MTKSRIGDREIMRLSWIMHVAAVIRRVLRPERGRRGKGRIGRCYSACPEGGGGAVSQVTNGASRSWTRQGGGFCPRASGKDLSPADTLS